MQVTAKKELPDEPTSFLARCSKCGHARVCSILRAIAPLMTNWDDKTRPFEADEIASICKAYISDQVIQILQESQQ